MAKKVSQFADELADREAIRDVILRYCRASDRVDEEMLRSVYWPDAHDDHMSFSGTADEFIAWSLPVLTAMRHNQHMVGNMLIAIDGNRAEAESYFHGYHQLDIDGKKGDAYAGGRYIDTLEKRDDEWRILRRYVAVDWFRELPDTGDWEIGPFGMKIARGDLKQNGDESYKRFKLIK